jgi:hypothetical protein
MQSYYISGRQLLNDADFDRLKEDLAWSGSKMVKMNRQETKYLAAVQAYLKGTPILSDAEFDQLKAQLKEEGSTFASSKEPKCYIGELLSPGWYGTKAVTITPPLQISVNQPPAVFALLCLISLLFSLH